MTCFLQGQFALTLTLGTFHHDVLMELFFYKSQDTPHPLIFCIIYDFLEILHYLISFPFQQWHAFLEHVTELLRMLEMLRDVAKGGATGAMASP